MEICSMRMKGTKHWQPGLFSFVRCRKFRFGLCLERSWKLCLSSKVRWEWEGQITVAAFAAMRLLCEPRQQGVHKNYVCTECKRLSMSACVIHSADFRSDATCQIQHQRREKERLHQCPGTPCLRHAVHNNPIRLRANLYHMLTIPPRRLLLLKL